MNTEVFTGRAALAAIAVTLLLGLPVAGRAAAVTTLRVVEAWSRATAPGTSVGVAYFEIVNEGAADTLQSIESPVAQRVEMHSSASVNGMMQMREMSTVDIPAKAHVRFEPGGLHAMLMELSHPLRTGERLPLTLIFAHAGALHVEAVVQGMGAAGPPDAQRPAAPAAAFKLAAWPLHAVAPDFRLIDVDRRSRTLADYRGSVLVVFFGFMHCPDACPAELFKLALVMKRLGPLREHVRVLFITLDPQRDSGPKLKRYVTAFDPRFIGLTGTTAQIDAAAGSFAVEYAKVGTGPNYSIDHSTTTFVFDSGGRLRLVGSMSTSAADYAHDLALLAAPAAEVSPRSSGGPATP
jgi:protein SCO1/2